MLINKKLILTIFVVVILLALVVWGALAPGEESERAVALPGFEGVSWTNVVPIKKTTLVNYDPDSYIDDYAYLAAVPASVFYSQNNDKLFSNPLLFYEPSGQYSGQELTLNAGQGVEYFMEDWQTYNKDNFDIIQTINVPQSDISDLQSKWNASHWNSINVNPGRATAHEKLASEIALFNWEHSEEAVVAVAEGEYERMDEVITDAVTGTTPGFDVQKETFDGEAEPDPTTPIFHDFQINEGYKYITALLTWGSEWNPLADITERGKDPDLQLYCWEIGEDGAQVAASANWNVLSGASEFIGSYIYEPGDWSAAVTYMPTEAYPNEDEEIGGDIQLGTAPTEGQTRGQQISLPPDQIIPRPFDSKVVYTIYISKYPGVDIPLNQESPFGVREVSFKLSWSDSSQQLGLIVRGPSGAEIAARIAQSSDMSQTIELDQLGEGQYYVSVVNLGEEAGGEKPKPTEFSVEYSYHQKLSRAEGDGLASATEGAVLASTKNIPLLFTRRSSFSSDVKDALNELGVKKIYLIDLGNHRSSRLVDKFKDMRSLFQEKLDIQKITTYDEIYGMIYSLTTRNGYSQNDIVFSTIDSWTHSYVTEGIGEELDKALFIGPAAFAAAHHGCPVVILDVHPKLSCAQSWHNEFWKSAFGSRKAPSVGCMILTGKLVYDFMNDFIFEDGYGFDRPGQESILTVAGQFDIGTTWDRMLVGAAVPGRIQGAPTDTAYWIARSVFYPAMIFANPALNPALDDHGGSYITGSKSVRTGGVLNIIEDGGEVQSEFPVLQSWISYEHKFNELASEYWGCDYVTATGIVPFRTPSSEPIDNGFWPDMSSSEVMPYYVEQCGYGSNVYTTNFQTSMENLNRGVIMWVEVMHGGSSKGGVVGFWNEDEPESNPWRGYEENAMTMRGSTADPDVVTMNKHFGLDAQPGIGPITPAGIIPQSHDGIIIAIVQQQQTKSYVGVDFDNAMENIHSVGFNGGSCLIANTYLHTSLVRHGSVFQVIDPWLTSWYAAFAMECFIRDIALGYTVGEAYARGIAHVGILYLTGGWWWDIFENLVYYGDPDLRVYTPMDEYSWEEPEPLGANVVVNAHAPLGAKEHRFAISDTSFYEGGCYALVIVIAIVAGFIW
ncbi:MAG: hypothetical protein KAJ51_04155, partial [Thermoplasmata archaeon]|nr:hypothetical protein [Thermoplasmata archaeon]